jgi:hypothetical protein
LYSDSKKSDVDDDEDEEDENMKKKKLNISHSASLLNLTALVEKSKAEEGITNRHPILDQPVFVGGKDVSGGFAQAISLARVFVRTSAKIVILGTFIFSLSLSLSLPLSSHTMSLTFCIFGELILFLILFSIVNSKFQTNPCANSIKSKFGRLYFPNFMNL